MNTITNAADVVPFATAAVVAALFVVVAIEDATTSRVTVHTARIITALAVGGLGLWALVTTDWTALIQALIATVIITAIQLIPYGLQPSQTAGSSPSPGEGAWIGRADVRLGIPFAWTLGWFGLGFALVGFAAALLFGLLAGLVTKRRRIPFVPFLCIGLWLGLGWALARAVIGEG